MDGGCRNQDRCADLQGCEIEHDIRDLAQSADFCRAWQRINIEITAIVQLNDRSKNLFTGECCRDGAFL